MNDKETISDLKNDLDQLALEIEQLPTLTKMSLNLFGISNIIFSAKAAADNIFKEKDVDRNVNKLRKNINNLRITIDKNRQFDSAIKNFLGEDYFSKFEIVCDIVNKS